MKILLFIVISMMAACSSNQMGSDSQNSDSKAEQQQRDQMVRNLRLFHDKN